MKSKFQLFIDNTNISEDETGEMIREFIIKAGNL